MPEYTFDKLICQMEKWERRRASAGGQYLAGMSRPRGNS